MLLRKVQDTVAYLEKRGLIKRLGANLGGPSKGSIYKDPLPDAGLAHDASETENSGQVGDATVKDDDYFKKQSSSKGWKLATDGDPVEISEDHSRAAEPRERQENADRHLALDRAAYERVTGNRWSKSDSEAYNENGITKLPADKIISAMETVTQRTSAK